VLGGKTAAIALAVEDARGRSSCAPTRATPWATASRARRRRRRLGRARRTPAVEADPQLLEAAKAAGLTGPVIAAPLTLKDRMVGVIVIGRLGEAPFAEADLRLLVTFADQTATAIENARLYTEVRAFSEVLERRVRERDGPARARQLGARARAPRARHGAGPAHQRREDGQPGHARSGHRARGELAAAAVQGLVDALQDTVKRLGHCASDLFTAGLPRRRCGATSRSSTACCPR